MGDDDRRAYWPDGIKLDSKIIIDNDIPVRHEVHWVLYWADVSAFFAPDYYAHDLYLDKTDGTFLVVDDTFRITSTLPLVQRYRYEDGSRHLRIGWASYRPNQIEANTRYTVTLSSGPTDAPVDYFAEDVETYGIRIPTNCVNRCIWLPLSWCSIAAGGNTLLLRNNAHPDGIHALGTPFGGCNRLVLLFLPVVTGR